MALFFHGQFSAAFVINLVGSQSWRVYSEFLRADFGGGHQRFSTYKTMALTAALHGALIGLLCRPTSRITPAPRP